MLRHVRIHISVGDLLQLAGIGGICWAVAHLAGVWWAVLAGGVFVAVDANLSYSHHQVTVVLPNRQNVLATYGWVRRPFRAVRRFASTAVRSVRR